MTDASVSVIIPTFNCAGFLSGAIESVLSQEMPNCEVLVVDDGSTDGTRDVLTRFERNSQVRVLRHPGEVNRGVCASRRLAFGEAAGEFVAFLDADDRFLPRKLAKHVEVLRSHADAGLVHSAVHMIDASSGKELALDWWPMGDVRGVYDLKSLNCFLLFNCICNSTVVCRRNLIGLEDLPESMVLQFEDWYLWNVLAFRCQFYYDPEPLTDYRVHADSFTSRILQRQGAAQLARAEMLLRLLSQTADNKTRKRASRFVIADLLNLAAPDCAADGTKPDGNRRRVLRDLCRATVIETVKASIPNGADYFG